MCVCSVLTWQKTSSHYALKVRGYGESLQGWKERHWILQWSVHTAHLQDQPVSFLSLSAFQALETSTMTGSTIYQLPPNTFLAILHGNYLKLVIYGHIGFLVKVLEGDAKAVIASSGELVNSFKAKPDFTWNYFYSSTVLILIVSTNSFKFTLWCKSSFIFLKCFLEVVGHVKVVTIVLFKMRTPRYLGL